MTNTPFSKKVEILADFYAFYSGNGVVESSDFWLDWSDTLWICLAAKAEWITINEPFHEYVNGAWNTLCEYIGIDSYGNYESLEHVIRFANEQG